MMVSLLLFSINYIYNNFADVYLDEQSINQALLSLNSCDDSQQISINTISAVAVAELPTGITDSLNVAAKRLSLLYDSTANTTTTEHDEDRTEEENNEIADGSVQPCSEQETGKN